MHETSLGVPVAQLNSTDVSFWAGTVEKGQGIEQVDELDHLATGELIQLLDSQTAIIELLAANTPLERVLVELCDRFESDWSDGRTHVAIGLSSEEEGRSVLSSTALTEGWSGDQRSLFPAAVFRLPAGPVAASSLNSTSFDSSALESVHEALGTEVAWFVPVEVAGGIGCCMVLFVHDSAPAGPADAELLRRYGRLASLAVERHLSELRLHRLIAEERQRLAGVLHDDPIQAMTAVGLRAQRLARHVDGEAADMVSELQRSVSTAIERMRRLLIDLHPPTLDNEGLVSAIDVYLAEVLEPLGLACELVDRVTDEPSIETASLAYRLVSEALWNVAKHAEASSVRVEIEAHAGSVEITVADDGKGFDTAETARARAGHIGMSACRALSARASGSWIVDSSPGRGTIVTIRLPGELPLKAPEA